MSSAGFAPSWRAARATRCYSQAAPAWIDLSTGVNPRRIRRRGRAGYAQPAARHGELSRLEAVAAGAFALPLAAGRRHRGYRAALRLLPMCLGWSRALEAASLVGLALPLMWAREAVPAALVSPPRLLQGPTYGSHADGMAQAGCPRGSLLIRSGGSDRGPDGVIVVNPNNPDGRVMRSRAGCGSCMIWCLPRWRVGC